MYDLPTTVLGRTGLTVTRLGIGGAYCKTPAGYRKVLDAGVTYIDTAPAYQDGQDEAYIGEAITGRRHDLVVATKTMKRDASGARKELETSLRLLNTDYIDVWQTHYLNKKQDREQALGPGGALEAAVKAREQGLIRFVGVTGHAWTEISKAVATGAFDTVLCWYSCAKREPEKNVFVEAQKHNTGVIIMNATGTDKLIEPEDSPSFANFYRYVLDHPTVKVVLRGLRDVDQFVSLAAELSVRSGLTEVERKYMELFGRRMRRAEKSQKP